MPKASLLTSLLIIALADNLSDSLSIHIYQESERLDETQALRATITNFLARILVGLSFVGLVAALPAPWLTPVSVVGGLALLAGLSFAVARARSARPWPEVVKHLGVATLVIALSRAVAALILAWSPG